MTLEVPIPEPPTVYRDTRDEEYVTDASKRADIQEYFDGSENAWEEGFSEWAAETALDEDEFQLARDLSLFEEFDFYWDASAGRVAHEPPAIPRDWRERERFAAVDSWSTVSAINEELDELGETVAGVLTNYYVDWESEEHVVETFGDQYNGRDDVLTDEQDAHDQ